jgi:hypothetical protein
MSDFNPFVDFSKLTDDEIIERLNKINNMISYYYWTPYTYIVPQLQGWQESAREELRQRNDKRRRDKAKNKQSNVVFDNSEEELEKARNKDKEEKQP